MEVDQTCKSFFTGFFAAFTKRAHMPFFFLPLKVLNRDVWPVTNNTPFQSKSSFFLQK